MDISKVSPDNFIKLTTEGYPITLRHNIDEFYEMFVEFINHAKDNNFVGEIDEGVIIYAGMKTEVCKVLHSEGKVTILSKISNTNDSSTTDEFNLQEEFQILGHACLGVLYFCDLYASATGQNVHFEKEGKKSDVANNKKYNIWPM